MKAIFFDIDGTLLDRNGVVADSTVEALTLLKKAGHKIFLCTGRTRSQIWPSIRSLGFDGVVSVAGAEASIGDEIIFQSFMDLDKVEAFLDLMEPKHCSFGLQSEDGSLCTSEGWDKTRDRFVRLGASKDVTDGNMKLFEKVDSLHGRRNVYKLFYNFIDETVDEIQDELGDYFRVEQSSFGGPDPYSGEITKRGVDKDTGMAAILEYLGLEREDAIAFGDGPNDAEMIRFAGTGVAMGNARDEIKDIADLVTDDIFHNGIYNACEKLGLFLH